MFLNLFNEKYFLKQFENFKSLSISLSLKDMHTIHLKIINCLN